MKNRIVKIVVAALAFLLMVVNTAEASFRVKKPSSAVRQQALMSLQSVGTSENETVETTTKEKPFTVDFAALGVENPTNAYLLIVNEQTGNCVELSAFNSGENKIQISPLVMAELEMQYLGANQSYRCISMCSTLKGEEEILSIQRISSSLTSVAFPNFSYKTEAGELKQTLVHERKLMSIIRASPSFIMRNSNDEAQRMIGEKLEKKFEYDVLMYQLPDGRYIAYNDVPFLDLRTGSQKTLTGNFSSIVCNGSSIFDGVQLASTTSKVGFKCDVEIVDNSVAFSQLKNPLQKGFNIWSDSLSGTVPISVVVYMGRFSSGPLYDLLRDPNDPNSAENLKYVIGVSINPPVVADNGNHIAYVTSLADQIVGYDMNPDDYDITLMLNTDMPFYYGTDGRCSDSKIDYVTIILHEMAHGLGFMSTFTKDGYLTYHDNQYWYPMIFDICLTKGGAQLVSMLSSPSSVSSALRSGALYFSGANTVEANGGKAVKMYAPYQWAPGSSVSHWDDSVSFDTFMKYQYHYPLHKIGAQKLGLMKDIGWSLLTQTISKPSVPTGVSATKGTVLGQVDVTWNAVNGATSYTVYRSESASGTYSTVKTGLTTCKYSDTGVSGTTHYYYKVAAVNSAGTSSQSSYVYGYAKAESVLTSIEVSGPATLASGEFADYTCTAHYSDGLVSKGVSTDAGCVWSLPYGGSYATLSGRRLTAGSLSQQKTVTIRAVYGGKTSELQVTILPKTLSVSFVQGNYGTASFTTRAYSVGTEYGTLPVVSNVTAGYEFLGWYTAASGGSKITAASIVSGSITKLYAQYGRKTVPKSLRIDVPSTIECGKSYTVHCYLMDSDGVEREVTSGIQWSIQNNGIPYVIKNGVMTLLPSETSTGTIKITVTVSGVPSCSVTVTSVNPVQNISLNANGGSVTPTSLSQKHGAIFSGLPTPTRSGYVFLGWYTAVSSGAKITNGMVYDGTYTTLYAHWESSVVLSSLAVSGDGSVVSGGMVVFVCNASFSDGSTMQNVPASWSASAGSITSSGLYTAPAVTANKSVTITASYTSRGVTKTATKTVTVTPKKVMVRFDANGGTVSPTSKEFAVGLTYGTLPTPVRGGYVFDGWFTALNETGIPVNASSSVLDGVTTLYAKWHEAVVLRGLTVQGSSSVVSGKTVAYSCVANYSDGTTAIVAPEWSITSGGTYATITAGGVLSAKDTTVSRTVVIRAVFGGFSATLNVVIRPRTVSVEFNGNGGIVSESTKSYVVGAKYDSLPTATRTSYRFLGWYTAASGGTRIFENTTVVESVTTLHAQWQENPPALKEIYITSENTGDTILSGSSLGLTCMAVFTNGIATTTSSLNGSDVTWSTSDESIGTVAAGGVFKAGRVTSSCTVTVTASYQGVSSPDYVISIEPERIYVVFDANGGKVSENSREFVVGAAYGELPVPTFNDDYRFDGWFTAADGGMRVTEASVCEKSVTRLYAHWVEVTKLVDLVITCDNVITSSVPAKFVCYGVYSDDSEIVVNPEWILTDPELGTINADGIYTAEYVPEETNIVVKATVGGITGAVEVVVHPMESSIRFDPCDGAVSPQRMTFTVGAAYGELPIPVRSRYDFEGWYTRPGKMGDKVTSDSIVVPEVDTLYAGWTPTPRTLSGIKIEGVESMTSGGSAVFSCKAVYADGTEGSVVPVWSIVNGLDYGSLTLSGYFIAEEVTVASAVTIQAVYTDKGIRYEDQHQVSILPSILVVDPGVVSLEADAAQSSILVDAYGNWEVSADVDWITLAKTSGGGIDTVPFSVTANTGNEERIGTISVKCGDLAENCVVKQYSPIPDEYVSVTLDTRIPDLPVSTRQYVKGRKFSYLPTPVRAGYAFGGWWTKPYGEGKRVHAMTIVSDDVLTLYGHWTDVSVAYALNNALDWIEDATKPWVFDYTDAKDRKVSMTTPALKNSQKSSLTALVEGPGTLNFYWKTSSEEHFDVLVLYVDGKFISSISGETGWRTSSVDVSGYGQHVVTWVYSKDGQGASGMDCAWLDMVTWMPDYAGNGASSIQSADGRSVPETWLNSFGLDTTASVVDEDTDGDGMTNYEEYIAGTDPLDQESNFRISIEMTSDGRPIIEAIPDLGDSATRTYIFEGKEKLTDKEWSAADATLHRFFRVRIEVR